MTETNLLPAGTVTILCAGDAPPAVFATPEEALATLAGGPAALHTGEALVRDDGTPTGPAVRRCEQLRELAADGRTLISAPVAAGLTGVTLHDLGVHRLPDLTAPERIFQLGGTPAPLRSLDAVPNNLPVQLTGFVGRESEAAEVRGRLAGGRLVTLAGPGGSGKTRLAAQVAAAAAGRWPDGVWWAELDAVAGRAEVAELVAATLGVPVEPRAGAARSVATELRDRRVLLCLDNCEQVLDGVADLAVALLRSCPEVAVLATSREPLGVPGETVWRVPPLAVEEAVALFVERAGAVRPLFTLDTSSAAAVRSVCARLDGIPLAVELAAAWLGTLTPHQIDAGLDDRFALLTRGPRGGPARQQTLAASIAWSHDQLDGEDRVVFRGLAVFAGGFTLDAAGGPAVLPALGRLVDKSLVLAENGRFRLLETLREYAAARLAEAGEADAVRDRHLDHFLALAEAAEPDLDRDKDAWRARMEPERDNLRAALEWGLGREDPTRGRRLAAAVAWLWNLRGRGHEGLAYLKRAVARCPDERSPLQARLLTGMGLVADTTAPFDVEAARLGLEIATELGETGLRARCLSLTALGHLYTDFDAAWDLALEAGKVAEAAGDGFARDSALMLRGIVLHARDRHDEADPLLAEAAEGLLRRGDRGLGSTVLSARSASALAAADLPRARELAERAVEVAAPLGDFHRVNTTLCRLAMVHCLAGDVDAGFRVMGPFLRLLETAGDVFVPGMAGVMGELHRRRGEWEEATRWFEREAVPGTYMASQGLAERGAVLRALGRAEEAAEVLATAVDLTRRWGLRSALADALDQQGYLAGPEQAAELHHEALALRLEHGLSLGVLSSLDALTTLLARTGREADAARVLVSASRVRAELGFPRRAGEQAELDALGLATAEAPMSLDDVVAFVRRTRGARGRPSSGWGSLTPTELEVVKLAAEGCTNPEIGARLFMSRGTVKTHLAHVYAKLGIANRTELATVAAAHRS
ncbi:LuxR C-terminal-related transcriptional regulator [Amycolatopsis mongoliensis]|uniref:LuxR C-terminal-related transcriptional regulator n=1 Tax=Amycolatopsis mongoliensis TaxID=715475 RepID=A0A9Y2NQL1_9PSEU|nr:LuxR C-terminal-related transcriptional regulator [Amycolatopsis sp. 4-36]WIY06795.1 LuxR C-terminal-related transcriptional regulator [Amycolatopsis sp. 4-36]